MRKQLLVSSMMWVAVLMCAAVQAQTTPPAPPAAGGTADGTPFDIPYGLPISLETARKVLAAVEAEALKHRWKLNIAVVDTHGDLVHFARMEGAQYASGNIAQGKVPKYEELVDLSFADQAIKELGEWTGPICPSDK